MGSNISVDAEGLISLSIANGSVAGLLNAADYNTFMGKQDALGYTPVNRAGDVMEGTLTLVGAPVNTNDAATKGYTDIGLAGKVGLDGATMSGLLILSGDPTQALGAATMQYVDNAVSAVSGSYAGPVQAIADLTAIASSMLVDKQMRLVENEGAIYRYDAQSTIALDGNDVVQPDDTPVTGRWIKVQAATQSHEGLRDLQGGALGDHLHLTTAEKNGYDAHLADYDLHLTSAQNTFLDSLLRST